LKKIHFIAIGGSIMHNLAIALRNKGYEVTGSDDEIFDPAKTLLEKNGLLPKKYGWYPENISTDLDAVILGMHARPDNPELIRTQELSVKIYSFPEYAFEQSKNKTRMVIGGSHGKTSITSMIMHALKTAGKDFDYLVGARLSGFDLTVKFSDAAIVVIEGDEYLSSPIDRRPKFHLYKPHIAVLSGIAWDHINVFPTFENYVEQFRIFIQSIEKGGILFYSSDDETLKKIVEEDQSEINKIAYTTPEFTIEHGITWLGSGENRIPLKVFGKHNLQNIEAARMVCLLCGLTDQEFLKAISSFSGASNRLQLLAANESTSVFKDFAHAPSKLKATIAAVKEQFSERKLTACIELHTFSSLNKKFLSEYSHSLDQADVGIVYFNPHTLEMKKLPAISKVEIQQAFQNDQLLVFNDSGLLNDYLRKQSWVNHNLLMMSSGNFDRLDLSDLATFAASDPNPK